MKRNHVTTNSKRQMQGAAPHRHWQSSAAHVDYQRAVKWYGADSDVAQTVLKAGVRPPSILTQLRDQALVQDRRSRAEKVIARMTQRRPRQPRSAVLPPELLQWAVQR